METHTKYENPKLRYAKHTFQNGNTPVSFATAGFYLASFYLNDVY